METVWEDIQLQDSDKLINGDEKLHITLRRNENGCNNDDDDENEHYLTPPDSPYSPDSPVDIPNSNEFSNVVANVKFRNRTESLIDELLNEIYLTLRKKADRCLSNSSDTSSLSTTDLLHKSKPYRKTILSSKAVEELRELLHNFENDVIRMNAVLLHCLKRRDKLITQRSQYFDLITAYLQAISPKRSVDTKMRFSVEPIPGDSGFSQWHDAMRMVARLPGGIPNEFRCKLWSTLADRHVQCRRIRWASTLKFCLNEKTNPDDDALGEQIVKDLHRTGCSLFSGEESEQNQALLKQVLLAFARWNKDVGYCQGFNMLAAIILEVMHWDVEHSLKVMIYLIEGVLPKGYFANNLRGLSIDMAVFRELLRLRLPQLSRHLDKLQHEAQDSSTGASYEPPLINVFTMQWFLTLFSNCIPKSSVLRIWDLIFLEGNEILLRTALAIWDCLADRIMSVDSADEFYSIMGVLTREMMEFGVTDTNELIKTICIMAPFPFPQIHDLREKYTFNIRPLTSSFALVKKGVQLFHSDDDEDNDANDDQIMVANWCISNALLNTKIRDGNKSDSRIPSPSTASKPFPVTSSGVSNFLSANSIDPQRMSLDVSLLKKQYLKLKERQRQAHIILTEGFQHSQSNDLSKRQRVPVNHLLIGKTALISKKPKRPSPVMQPVTVQRVNKAINDRSKTTEDIQAIAVKTFNEGSGSRMLGKKQVETLTWTQLKNENKLQKLKRKYSEPSLSQSTTEEMNAIDFVDVPSHSKNNASSSDQSPASSSNTVSTSSSSTGLCDTEDDFSSHSSLDKELHVQNQVSFTNNSNDVSTEEKTNEIPLNVTSEATLESNDANKHESLDERYVAIKRELSNLSVEECVQKLNEKLATIAYE